MNDQTEPAGRMKSRTKFMLLVMIAFGPILAAYVTFFYFPELVPTSTTNNGEFIAPPVSAEQLSPEFAETAKWAVLIVPVQGDDCREASGDCRQMLYLSRQVINGLGREANRMSRYLLVGEGAAEQVAVETGDWLEEEHPDVVIRPADLAPLREMFPAGPSLYLMDPNGNVMMRYSLDKAGKPMRDDLKHLLRLSKIG